MNMHLTTLPKAGEQRTMSSLEIAELTDKRHDNVMRDTRTMLVALHGEGGLLRFEDTYRNPQNGQDYPCFRLPYDETMTLITGYSIPLRAAVVRRWRELEEAKPALPNFSNPAEAARAWADEVELKRTVMATVAELASLAETTFSQAGR